MNAPQSALIATLLLGTVFTASRAQADANRPSTVIEIPVETALAPAQGYDDNDNVVLVLHGYLPNACYTLGKYKIEKVPGSKTLRIRQYALRDNQAICAEGATLPDHLAMMVPFTSEVSIGQLPIGDYEFEFKSAESGSGKRRINVAKAEVQTVDSLPYAAVSKALASDVVNGGDEVKVTLSGILNSTCTELNPEIRVIRGEDVSIVLPTVQVKTGVICAQYVRPFQTELNLGKLTPGHHLIHVRSMSGKSVNHVIEVAR